MDYTKTFSEGLRMSRDWIEAEFSSLDLGDLRRETRVKTIVEQLSSMAESPPDACRSNAALRATYRLVNNPAVMPESILDAHHDAAIFRTTQHKTVVLIQDTTDIDLTKPRCQVQGAGPLEHAEKYGFYFHPLYAVSEEGLPLGIVDEVLWTRESLRTDLTTAEKARLRKQQCYEEKESCRWLELFQSGEQLARAHPGTHYINVADSEADLHELFLEINNQASNHDLILRGCQNRAVMGQGAEEETRTVEDVLSQASVLFQTQARVSGRTSLIANETRSRRKSREARVATISVRAATLTVRGPARTGGKLPDVTLNVVEAIERDPPAGEEPIRWVLFTSLPIENLNQIERVIALYALRWSIELFFKTLKSGMKIEKLKYETLERFLTVSALMFVVAWRVEQIKMAARVDAEASCENYFDAAEWKPVYLVAKKTQTLPAKPPTMEGMILLIAQLGGYLPKTGQGSPGSITIWRGLRRMSAYREAYEVFGPG